MDTVSDLSYEELWIPTPAVSMALIKREVLPARTYNRENTPFWAGVQLAAISLGLFSIGYTLVSLLSL